MFDSTRSKIARRLALGAAFACLTASAAVAQAAGEGAAPNWLEQRVQGLEKGLAFFGGRDERPAAPSVVQPAQSSMADIAVRLDRLENQIRQLNGRIEEMQFQTRKNDENLRKMQGDVDFRLQDLESGKGGGGGSSKPARTVAATPATTAAPPVLDRLDGPQRRPRRAPLQPRADALERRIGRRHRRPSRRRPQTPMSIRPPGVGGGSQSVGASGLPDRNAGGDRMASRDSGGITAGSGSPNDQFALGVGFVQRRDYAEAEATFRDFLRSNPNDPKAAEARYWLGESLYQRKKYPDAVETFLGIYRDNPQSAKAPESMLKLGMALNGMGEKEQACATLDAAGKKYTRIKAQSDREYKRIAC
ncbi:tol-pal system protein YbgF [Chenggangzhangella methanolivorans]|uniref:Cell division coordinator CpoB n=1 Tax=Chenggangzhangella methanolivorans TaxID=1437009 RepID=A0A9E6RDK0_9HYPH|nr:tol-pal system protein YbgF [Chenggangzhangella methanolivorans]QZO01363.1 tol-pal system protein YbgF [Chenggangzhangella methanolivorans]